MHTTPARLGILTILLVLTNAGTSNAQQFQASIDFATLIPQGEFRDNVDNNGYGIGGHFLVRIKRTPILIGADLGAVTYGSEERREPLSSTIPDLDLKIETDNNIVLAHLLLRAQPRTGKVRPYADGLIGLKHLFTQTTIRSDFSDEQIASTTNFRDTTYSLGLGGGVQVNIYGSGNTDVWLDGKVRYLWGGRAEYLKKGSIRREGGSVGFDVLSSRTDAVAVQIGVTFSF